MLDQEGRERLLSYSPRLAVDWLRDEPQRTWRRDEGSLVFVDISGFTAMSERLGRRGRVGAEEVVDVIGATFARLLTVAYGDGGSLLKFGGDALLLWFSGDVHALRACHAAAGMRATLREIGGIKTSAGLVRLRMSVGVHSGEFDFFLIGTRHRELLVAGPGATTTVLMEQTATAGEIVVSAATASALPARLRGEAREGGALLRGSPPPPLVAPTATKSPGEADLFALVPESLRDHVVAGGDSEHRQVTLAFVGVAGVDEMLAVAGGAATAESLGVVLAAAQEATAAHGVTFLGSDVDAGGVKLFLAAGAPAATGSDEERMLRALRALFDTPLPLPVRAGVNSGAAFTGDVGPPYRRTYTAMGDTTNLAARLMGKAAPGEVIAANDVVARCAARCRITELEPFTVKGKRAPVRASRIEAVLTGQAASSAALPLIGRAGELDLLGEEAGRAGAGVGRLVEIVGESGLGKTRLIEELLRTVEADAASVHCEQYASGTPYHAVRALIRPLLGVDTTADRTATGEALRHYVMRSAPALFPWLPLLADVVGADVPMTPEVRDLDPRIVVQRRRETTLELLSALLAGPAVIVVEDHEWLDEASRDLFDHLTTRLLGARPWLLCPTRRPEDPAWAVAADVAHRVLVLDRLGPEAAVALAAVAADPLLLPRATVEAIAARAGGHPLFCLKLLDGIASGASATALPATVEAAIAARLDRLSRADRALLRQASVVGSSFALDVLAVVADAPAAGESRRWQTLAEFVVELPDGTYRFRQALVRFVAYESLPFRLRRDLHVRAGEAIERLRADRLDDVAALLGLHFSEAGDHERAWTYAKRAGHRAESLGAVTEAATHFRRALAAVRHLGDESAADISAVWEVLGDVLQLAGLYDEADRAFASARRIGAPVAQPRLCRKVGILRERKGEFSSALRWHRRGIVLAEGRPECQGDRLKLMMATAIAYSRQSRYRECINLCHQVIAESEAAGERGALPHAYNLLLSMYSDQRSPEVGKYKDQAVRLFEEAGDLAGLASALEVLGADAQFEGEWDEATTLHERSRQLRERTGHLIYQWLSTCNIAEIRLDQGRLAEAEEMFHEARRVFRASSATFPAHFATLSLGRAAARAGRWDEAAALLAEAREGCLAIHAEQYVLEVIARQAELAVLRGEPASALARIGEAQPAAERLDLTLLRATLQRLRAEAMALSGDLPGARAALTDAERLATQARSAYETALVAVAYAKLAVADGGDGEPYRSQAVAALERMGVVDIAARIDEPAS